jgi:hypothetical protein
MNPRDALLARLIALLLLIGSVLMLAPVGVAVIQLLRGADVSTATWLTPLVIMALGSLLTFVLSRMQVSLPLYLAAFGLWLVTVVYYFAVVVF